MDEKKLHNTLNC